MRVLAVGAHPDDIELGCGATLLAHSHRGDDVILLVMTTGERGPQNARSRITEQQDAASMLGAELRWGGFEDGSVPDGFDSISFIESAVREFHPDVVYTHAERDTHQDHRSTANATIAACRRVSRVLHYEGPTSVDFRPVLYVDAADRVEAKMNLIRAHVSQVLKNGLVDLEACEALARHRGFMARLRSAEAFEVNRFAWDLPNMVSRGGSVTVDARGRLDLREKAVLG